MWRGSPREHQETRNLSPVRQHLRHHQGEHTHTFNCRNMVFILLLLRSNRVKQNIHGHRSVSQERMSTSWAGHHSQPAHQQPGLVYQAQMEAEAKRRIGASLAMPPPSQSNTLRKPVASKQAPTEFTVAGGLLLFKLLKGVPKKVKL